MVVKPPAPLTAEEKEQLQEFAENFNFGFKLVPSQASVANDILSRKYKFYNIDAGRNWGKDLLIGLILFSIAIKNKKLRILFFTPFYSQIESFFDQVFEGVDPRTGKFFIPQGDPENKRLRFFTINHSKKEIEFFNGAKIVCRSTDNKDAIRSKRGDLIVMNECAFIPDIVINKHIMSCLRDNPWAITIRISTPNGCNHFYDYFQQGMRDPNHEDFDPSKIKSHSISYHRTYKDNPLAGTDILTEYATKSQRELDEEVLARFLRDSTVFRNLQAALYDPEYIEDENTGAINISANQYRGTIRKTDSLGADGKNVPKSICVAGLDLAKEKDWTVLSILDEKGKLVCLERTQKEDYEVVCKRVVKLCKEYNVNSLLFDGTGMQAGIFGPMLMKAAAEIGYELEVTPYTFSNNTKEELISNLSVRIEQEKGWIANIPVLVQELRNLVVKRTAVSGLPKYEAPSGKHDDCVFSLALANLLYVVTGGAGSLGSDDDGTIDLGF